MATRVIVDLFQVTEGLIIIRGCILDLIFVLQLLICTGRDYHQSVTLVKSLSGCWLC